jgi:hypothetical protein
MTKLNPYAWFAQRFVPGFYLVDLGADTRLTGGKFMWKFVERLKNREPRTAREFAGFPIEYDWKEVPISIAAIQDDRIMADGRPAHAWWAEIQMLRQREPDLRKREADMTSQMIALRIAKWAITQELPSGDTLIRYRWDRICLDPAAKFMENPGKYCEIVPPK